MLNMRICIFSFCLLFCVLSVSPYEFIVLEENNEYGGRTIVRLYDEAESLEVNYSKATEYYDSENIIAKRTFELAGEIITRTGILVQSNYYLNGNIDKYEMFFSDDHYKTRGYNRIIEEIDIEGNIKRQMWVYNNTLLDYSDDPDDSFTFYNLSYLEKEFFAAYEPNESGGVVSISGKYFKNRSVVIFDTELYDLSGEDIYLMNAYSTAFSLNSFSQYFTKKIKAMYEETECWVYVQSVFEQHVPGQKATVKFYPIGWNKVLYLICIEVYKITE